MSALALSYEKVEAILAKTAGVDSYNTIGGYGILTSSYQPNFGSFFVRLKPWEERHSEGTPCTGGHGDVTARA